ncbi:MAG TPA: metallophosphoesterase family protein [archaeon]|nr:metallophosphoesterase family protein [archaeon]
MQIAVISDIHANCFALDAALADLRENSVDRIVCLGDTVQGGAQPAETLERLRELECSVVMGNADAWLLDESDNAGEPASRQQRDVRAWTLAQLSAADLNYIRGFQRTVKVRIDDGRRLLCFHGSPYSYDDVLLPETSKEDWDRLLGQSAYEMMAGGHTHTQQVRRIGESLFFNPGSIGVVYNYSLPKEQFHTDPWAEYAILSCGQVHTSLSFHRVPYDVEDLIGTIEASGRPHVETMVDDYRRQPVERTGPVT